MSFSRTKPATETGAELDGYGSEASDDIDIAELSVEPAEAMETFDRLLGCMVAQTPVVHVCAGAASSYLVGRGGEVLCFGRGEGGELGVDSAATLTEDEEGELYSSIPRSPEALGGISIKTISASAHVLAITDQGALFSWGVAANGRLGLGPPSTLESFPELDDSGARFQPTPTHVTGVEGARIIGITAAESHSIAITEEGLCFSWGLATLARLGLPQDMLQSRKALGARSPRSSLAGRPTAYRAPIEVIDEALWEPVLIPGLEIQTIASVSAGRAHSLALSDQGRVYGWGCARYGRLGIGAVTQLPREKAEPVQFEPRLLSALNPYRVLAVATGAAHSVALCAPRSDDEPLDAPVDPDGPRIVFSWGLATCGRLGLPTGNMTSRSSTASFNEYDEIDIEQTVRFANFSFDIDDDEPYAMLPRRIPVLGAFRVVSITAGSAHSLALTADGVCFGWGLANHGRLGVGNEGALPEDDDGDVFVEVPQQLRGLNGYEVARVDAGDAHTIALTSTGQLLSWGMAAHGRLGFTEGALTMPREVDDLAYQPLPRQVWAAALLPEEGRASPSWDGSEEPFSEPEPPRSLSPGLSFMFASGADPSTSPRASGALGRGLAAFSPRAARSPRASGSPRAAPFYVSPRATLAAARAAMMGGPALGSDILDPSVLTGEAIDAGLRSASPEPGTYAAAARAAIAKRRAAAEATAPTEGESQVRAVDDLGTGVVQHL